MVQCSKCGFLAVWLRDSRRFEEASEYFRDFGRPEYVQNDEAVFQAKCFIRRKDLVDEYWNSPRSATQTTSHSSAVKGIIVAERNCDGFSPWLQGVHPKEHREMLMTNEMLESQRRNANHSLWAAIATAVFTGLSVIIGAYITSNSASVGAKATIEAARLQIEAQKEINKQITPINVTVQLPEFKQPIAEQSIPPKTTHGQKLPQP